MTRCPEEMVLDLLVEEAEELVAAWVKAAAEAEWAGLPWALAATASAHAAGKRLPTRWELLATKRNVRVVGPR